MVRPIPITPGETYGRLTVIASEDGAKSLFRCLCGSQVILPNKRVRSGNTKSCGCLHADRARSLSWDIGRQRLVISPGEVHGRLTAVRPASSTETLFICECGAQKVAKTGEVLRKSIQSCGCLQVDRCGCSLNSKGGYAYAGTVEYRAWTGMRYRCNNPNNPAWKYYGGKGIRVAPEWSDFSVFLSDMGKKPTSAHSIDRIDGSGDYCAANCRWADIYQQNQNRGNVAALTVWGVTKPLPQWAREFGISAQTLRKRLSKGMTAEGALCLTVGRSYV